VEKTLLNEEDASLDSIWWRDLRKVCEGKSGVKWFYNGVSWRVGVGDKIRFWKDDWVEGQCLASLC